MARPVNPLIIDAAQHQELEQMIKRPTTPQREVKRARIVLLRAEGKSQEPGGCSDRSESSGGGEVGKAIS
ncbi:MAG: hypothetical protein J6386_19445 [Candidatus Synoicihabitans palmerolidicus]|nr:hypothetical protein [Candidatus Synoicihabitans palmerolidicus]